MMGPTTLKEIRQQLLAGLKATGEDPIEWLEKRMAVEGKDDTLESLKRFIERNSTKKKRRKRRATAKK
jgi:hypothetical protein